MRAQPGDTDPRAERVQIDSLRKVSVAQRAAIAFSLSETVIRLARKAIRQQAPLFTDREVLLRFAAIHYGAALAEDVRRYLIRKSM